MRQLTYGTINLIIFQHVSIGRHNFLKSSTLDETSSGTWNFLWGPCEHDYCAFILYSNILSSCQSEKLWHLWEFKCFPERGPWMAWRVWACHSPRSRFVSLWVQVFLFQVQAFQLQVQVWFVSLQVWVQVCLPPGLGQKSFGFGIAQILGIVTHCFEVQV